MKSRIFNFLFVFAFSAWSASAYSARPYYYLTINVNNILIHKGKMHIGIYNNEQDFDNKKYYAGTITDVKGKTFKIVFQLPKGTYAVQMLQEKNNNKKMNSNLLVPQQRYDVSCAVFGLKKKKKTRFTLDKNKSINIKLKN